MKDRTLITGFGAFLGIAENPSAVLARSLGLPFEVLDVSYEAVERFFVELDRGSFDRLMLMGVAAGREHVCPELFARNTYGPTPDVCGITRTGEIRTGGPLLLGSTLFQEDSLAPVLVANRHTSLSFDAGSYLCNFAYYTALASLPTKEVGFVHVPEFDAIPFELQVDAIEALLAA